MDPKSLYEKLFAYYGPQNWWPGEGFEIAIGAILTQNTSWSNVEKAIANLKRNDLLDPEKLLECDLDLLKSLIKPAGFFNQKARYLLNLCKFWVVTPTPTREELLLVKGVGEETADSILLYLLNEPEFVIDAYTIRISTRLGLGTSTNKQYWKRYFENNLEKNLEMFNEYHALFVAHAKTFCKKNTPLCTQCFLNTFCKNKMIKSE
ncbi:MAG: endonuclease III domain-containing protein [Candidatus Heimdallarchaeota archaeon]